MRSRASHGGGGAHGLEDGFSTIKRIGAACASFRMKLSSSDCSLPAPPHPTGLTSTLCTRWVYVLGRGLALTNRDLGICTDAQNDFEKQT